MQRSDPGNSFVFAHIPFRIPIYRDSIGIIYEGAWLPSRIFLLLEFFCLCSVDCLLLTFESFAKCSAQQKHLSSFDALLPLVFLISSFASCLLLFLFLEGRTTLLLSWEDSFCFLYPIVRVYCCATNKKLVCRSISNTTIDNRMKEAGIKPHEMMKNDERKEFTCKDNIEQT